MNWFKGYAKEQGVSDEKVKEICDFECDYNSGDENEFLEKNPNTDVYKSE